MTLKQNQNPLTMTGCLIILPQPAFPKWVKVTCIFVLLLFYFQNIWEFKTLQTFSGQIKAPNVLMTSEQKQVTNQSFITLITLW